MASNYYQNTGQGWGNSQQYEIRTPTPPPPNIRPEPRWTGWDYYRAYASKPSRSLFDYIFDRVIRAPRAGSYNSRDARSFHRRVYGGTAHPSHLPPAELGSAAAYEAYRTWKHHPTLFPALGVKSERAREGLVGHSMAEASRLWQDSGRGMDTYGQRDALESAAATGSLLYYRRLDEARESGMNSYGRSSGAYEVDSGYRRGRRMSVPSAMRSTTPYGTPSMTEAQLGLPGSYGSGGLRGSEYTPPSPFASPFNSLRGSSHRNSTMYDSTGMGAGGGFGGGVSGSYPEQYGSTQYTSGMPVQSGFGTQTQPGYTYPAASGSGGYNATAYGGAMQGDPSYSPYQAAGGYTPNLGTSSSWSTQPTYGGSGSGSAFTGGFAVQPGMMNATPPIIMDSGRRSKNRRSRRSHSVDFGVGKHGSGGSYSNRYY